MKILFFTIGPELVASSRIRVYQYLKHLRKENIEAKIINYVSLRRCRKNLNLLEPSYYDKVADRIFSWWQTARVLFFAPYYDVLFIQKVLLSEPALNLLKRLNDNIIFDFDDAIYLSDRFKPKQNQSKGDIFLKRFNHTLRLSRYIIATSEYNKAYAERFNPNIVIITGPIDTERYVPKRRPQPVHSDTNRITIGWIGSPEATGYLKPLVNVFKCLAVKYKNLAVMLIGVSAFNIEGVNLILKRWRLDTEVEDLQNFDIGIMPLENDDWSRGKAGYKILQYMAIGIPCVASPVSVNCKIVKDGITGFLAGSEDEWLDRLSKLSENLDLRCRMGRQARHRAEEIFSYEANLPKFLAILKNKLKKKM